MSDMNQKPHKDIKDSVMSRIESEKIEPISRWYWLSHEYALWGAWGASVLFGALAVSVASFASLHIGYALYEVSHNDFIDFVFDALPYLWLGAFFVMVLAAYFNLRHTKRGYRYPILLVVGSSIGFSFLGGGMLHAVGAGWYIDRMLGEVLPAYQSREKLEERFWQAPLAGRFVGKIIEGEEAEEGMVAFVDAENNTWLIDLEELRQRDLSLLQTGKKVRLLAATSSDSDSNDDVLYACAVFPWLLDHAPPFREFQENRRMFIENIREEKEKIGVIVKEQIDRLEPGEEDEERPLPMRVSGVCANLPIFQKM